MNEAIENLSRMDIYRDLEEEIAENPLRKSMSGLTKVLVQNIIPENYMYKRFPFLWYYNDYKQYLPNKFVIDLLLKIASEYNDKLEEITNYDLKYIVTEKFFMTIERYFWRNDLSDYLGILVNPEIFHIQKTDAKTFDVLINYQRKMRNYLRYRKEKELELFNKETSFYHRNNLVKIIAKKINDLASNTQECIIPFERILHMEDNNNDNLNRVTPIEKINVGIFDEIIRNDSQFIELPGYLVVKKNLKKINTKIRCEMTVEELYCIFNEINIPEDLLSYEKIGYFIYTILTGMGYTYNLKDWKNIYDQAGPTRCIILER
jgi:hypothetical protein